MNSSPVTASFDNLLQQLREHLVVGEDKPDENPDVTLRCLWALAAGQSLAVSQAAAFVPGRLDPAAQTRLLGLVEQRLQGAPLAHLTGRQDFMGRVLLASPAALVPRRETEQLGYAAVERLRTLGVARPLVVDICTGAGNVALGIACHVPDARVFAADLSPEAVELAGRNATFVGRPDVGFRCGDLLAPFDEPAFHGTVDVLTCNPPYISSARVEGMPLEISGHEPRLAFDGGPFGVKIIRRVTAEAPRFLRPGGWLLMEIGAGQGDGVARSLARDPHYDTVEAHQNTAGQIRVIEARRSSDTGSEHATDQQ